MYAKKTHALLGLRAAAGAMAVSLGMVTGMPFAVADSYPIRPITYVIPFPPGGSTDTTGRMLAEEIGKRLNQNIIVMNRGGAGGNIGATHVAGAAADGYTLLQGTIGTHGINPTLYANLPFDARKDFEPVARMTAGTNVLVVHPSVPAKTVQELIDYAKENPNSLMMGSSGSGSSIHMSGELFQFMTGTKFTHVPYRGGGPAGVDLIAGHIHLMFDNINVALPHIQSGRLRALAVTSAERTAVLPDVPTMKEAGLPEYEMTSWSGVFAPAGTSAEIVEKLNATINEALSDEKVRARFEAEGIHISIMDVQEFREFVSAEIDRWGEVVRQAGLQSQ